MEEQQPPGQIEVGASLADGDLRYWRAKEAVRQGELRLFEQAAIRTALEARATAITGWASASMLPSRPPASRPRTGLPGEPG